MRTTGERMKKQPTPPEIIARFKTTEEALALDIDHGIPPPDKQLEISNFLENFNGKGTTNPDYILKKTYEYIDLLMDLSVNKHAVCSRGCAHCCKIKVDMLEVEALYIQLHTKFMVKKKQRDTSGYCPLLNKKTGDCRIYKYRPAPCRIFTTVDNPKYWAQGPDVNHAIFSVHSFQSEEGKKSVISYLLDVLDTLEANYQRTKDIKIQDLRYYFSKK